MLYLGIDTSAYTTSLGVVDERGRIVVDKRIQLPVPRGQRGLRPSDAVFFHVQGLRDLAESLSELVEPVAGVAASCRPRPAKESYLPVFRVSDSWGRGLAGVLRTPFLPTTHQEGHLAAGLWSSGFQPGNKPFLALHLSGGTTEVLRVSLRGEGFEEEILGRTRDLHAGQLIDRVGVALGLPFPSGKSLEELAARGRPGAVSIPAAVKGPDPSFSGAEAQAGRLIRAGCPPEDLALGIFDYLRRTLEKIVGWAVQSTGLSDILLIGGVSANKILRQKLCFNSNNLKLWWPEPRYCTDNAVGTALLAAGVHSLSSNGGSFVNVHDSQEEAADARDSSA